MRIKTRHALRKKDAKRLMGRLVEKFGTDFGIAREGLELAITDEDFDLVIQAGKPVLIVIEDDCIPTLRILRERAPDRYYVEVDMGAVKPILNGADVMGPGVRGADPSIREGDLVYVRTQETKSPIAVGIALRSYDELTERGKSVKTLHVLNDEIWRGEIE